MTGPLGMSCFANKDDLIAHLREEIERLRGERGPFICGAIGKADSGGLHDGYLICPKFGSDYVAAFVKRAD